MDTYNPDTKYSPILESGNLRPNIKSMLDKTPFIETLANGNVNFLYAFNGSWYKFNVNSEDELRVKKLGIGLTSTEAIIYGLTLANGLQFGNPSYSAGSYKFDGTGFLFDYNNTVANQSFLSIDNLLVRKNLTVFDLLVIQKRFTNGSLFVSNGAKVRAVNGTTITFEDPSSTGLCPFEAGDLILTIRYKPDSTTLLRSVYATVSSVSGNSVVVSYTSGTFQIGDDVARVGNTTTASRQGMVYLTADDTTAPYIDIVTGVNSWAAWSSTNKVVARLGRLKDYPTTAFGGTVLPDVIGLFIKNNLYIEDGFIALGTQGYVKSGLTSYSDVANAGFYLGWDLGTNKFKIRNSATKYFDYDGTNFAFVGGTITSGVIQTATSGRRIVINESGDPNTIKFYDTSGSVGYLWGDNTFISCVGNLRLVNASSTFSISDGATGFYTMSADVYGVNWNNAFNVGSFQVPDGASPKFSVNPSGQITKINNVVTSGYVPISNGTHFEPRALTVSDVTNAVSTAGSYANPSWITSLDKSKITGLTASTICASTAGGVLSSTSFAPTILFDPAVSYGEMIEANSSTTITMDGTNYVKFTGTATGSCGSGVTYSATNDDLTVDAGVQGKYLVTYNVTAKADTAGEYYWAILLTGTAQNKTRQILNHTAINTNYSVSGSAILTLGDGDTIAIGCFGTNTRVVTVTYLNVNITKISN